MEAKCPPFGYAGKYYQSLGGGCVRQASFFQGKPVLNQSVGYSVILGFGAFFAVFTSFLVRSFKLICLLNLFSLFFYFHLYVTMYIVVFN